MNGEPMLEDNRDVIGLLRAAGHGAPQTEPKHVREAIAAGQRIRRRRAAVRLGGTGALASVAVFGLLAVRGPASEPMVVQPADPGGSSVSTPATAATPAPFADPPEPGEPRLVSAREAALQRIRDANIQFILDALGPDFRKARDWDNPSSLNSFEAALGHVELIPGSPTARQLPPGYRAAARLWAFDQGAMPLDDLCKPSVDQEAHIGACSTHVLPDGRVVQVQDWRTNLGEYQPLPPPPASGEGRTFSRTHGAWDQTTVYYARPDSTFARLELIVADSAASSTPGRQKVAVAWLGTYIDRLSELVTDPRIGPTRAYRHGLPPDGPADQPAGHRSRK